MRAVVRSALLLAAAACGPDRGGGAPADGGTGSPDGASPADAAPGDGDGGGEGAPGNGGEGGGAEGGGDGGGADGEGEGEGEGGDVPAPPCDPGAAWVPGTAAFAEVTAAWGLEDLGVVGTRLSVIDLEGDGRPDLLVRGDAAGAFVLRNAGGVFEDVTDASGLPPMDGPVASGDVDGDGDVDIYVAATVHDPAAATRWSEVMLNDGAGVFTPAAAEGNDARYQGRRAVPAGATFADVDLDGVLDLWVTHNMASGASQAMQDDLLLGRGDGTFDDATFRLGLGTADWSVRALDEARGHSWAWSSAACDLNGDGLPELLAASYGRQPNLLWQAGGAPAAGTLRYTNRSVDSGYAFDGQVDWTDNVSAQCHCRDNPGDDECDRPPDPDPRVCASLRQAFGGRYRWDHALDRHPFRLGGNSAATLCADLDNDGDIDLVTGEIRHSDVGGSSDPAELLVNVTPPGGDVRFERPGNAATGLSRDWPDDEIGWDEGAMTGAVLDFDNDGWQDLYLGLSDYQDNRGWMFRQDPGAPGTFLALAPTEFFEQARSHGVVAADFDGDGDPDLAVGHSLMRCGGQCLPTAKVRLFENRAGGGHWLRLRLRGAPDPAAAGLPADERANSSAIGARVTVATPDGTRRTQEVDGGHGHFNTQRDLALHFGLGDACTATVTVRWPSRALSTQTHTLRADQAWMIPQGGEPMLGP